MLTSISCVLDSDSTLSLESTTPYSRIVTERGELLLEIIRSVSVESNGNWDDHRHACSMKACTQMILQTGPAERQCTLNVYELNLQRSPSAENGTRQPSAVMRNVLINMDAQMKSSTGNQLGATISGDASTTLKLPVDLTRNERAALKVELSTPRMEGATTERLQHEPSEQKGSIELTRVNTAKHKRTDIEYSAESTRMEHSMLAMARPHSPTRDEGSEGGDESNKDNNPCTADGSDDQERKITEHVSVSTDVTQPTAMMLGAAATPQNELAGMYLQNMVLPVCIYPNARVPYGDPNIGSECCDGICGLPIEPVDYRWDEMYGDYIYEHARPCTEHAIGPLMSSPSPLPATQP